MRYCWYFINLGRATGVHFSKAKLQYVTKTNSIFNVLSMYFHLQTIIYKNNIYENKCKYKLINIIKMSGNSRQSIKLITKSDWT